MAGMRERLPEGTKTLESPFGNALLFDDTGPSVQLDQEIYANRSQSNKSVT